MTLSFEKSPRPWSGNPSLHPLAPRRKIVWTAPATAEDLREIQADLRKILSLHHGRVEHLMGQIIPSRLSRIDHLIAIHLCGYEFRPEGRRGSLEWSGGPGFGWKTGAGTYSADATRRWTTDSDEAADLAGRYSPHLRLDVRFGGARHGQIRKARFDTKHPVPGLAGRTIPLPEEWPRSVRRFPAAAIIDTFLSAFIIEKEAAASDARTGAFHAVA